MCYIHSTNPRDILNEIKWKGLDLALCNIHYIHRGAPGDTMKIQGSQIKTIGRSFFENFQGTSIPYHRIFRMEFEGTIIYKKILPAVGLT